MLKGRKVSPLFLKKVKGLLKIFLHPERGGRKATRSGTQRKAKNPVPFSTMSPGRQEEEKKTCPVPLLYQKAPAERQKEESEKKEKNGCRY